MAIDWGLAGRVGGIGFGIVFIILIILAVVTQLVGKMLSKITTTQPNTDDRKKRG